ncbi:MAG: KpsF/GutQ family sugar-phosphate isomerase [Candidatus Marinimicrobia bacterium]|nr:KpsF/GutQ family sugar-phosphate isomerase [Candidatus Neomarinimicrobiota bacterium]
MPKSYFEKAKKLIRAESEAIANLENRIDDKFKRAVDTLYNVKGKVIIIGVGKSGLIGRKIAATLSSTGTPSFFVHAYEAGHGDLGGISKNDALIVVSNSGETDEIIYLIPFIKKIKVPIIGLLGKTNSTLANKCDIVLSTCVEAEPCPLGIVPTASAIVTMAMGDALAVALMDKRQFKKTDFAGLHPAGSLGRRLLTTVSDLMHRGDQIPFAIEENNMHEVLFVMTKKGLGVVGILDSADNVVGVITDGDLRRGLEKTNDFLNHLAKDIMSKNPKCIDVSSLAIDALHLMEEFAITNLFVFDELKSGKPTGIIHIHDILRYGIMS